MAQKESALSRYILTEAARVADAAARGERPNLLYDPEVIAGFYGWTPVRPLSEWFAGGAAEDFTDRVYYWSEIFSLVETDSRGRFAVAYKVRGAAERLESLGLVTRTAVRYVWSAVTITAAGRTWLGEHGEYRGEVREVRGGVERVKQLAENPKPLRRTGGRREKGVVAPSYRTYTQDEYFTARIARDHPEILERMRAGEFRTARAAAQAAGIIRTPSRRRRSGKYYGGGEQKAEVKQAEVKPQEPAGEDHENEGVQGADGTLRRGETTAYYAARLKRDHPEIHERLVRGEFRSVRAAAIEAGIVRVPTATATRSWPGCSTTASGRRRRSRPTWGRNRSGYPSGSFSGGF